MFNFFSSKDSKEEKHANSRVLRKAALDSDRELRKLDALESKLILDIKKAAKENSNTCKILAKQLVDLRKQKERFHQTKSRIRNVESRVKFAESNSKLTSIMSKTTGTLSDLNKKMNPIEITNSLKEFGESSTKLQLADELINDNLDEILAASDDEDDQKMNQVMNQVLDEIGIEMSDKLSNLPKLPDSKNQMKDTDNSATTLDDDILKKLEKLKS